LNKLCTIKAIAVGLAMSALAGCATGPDVSPSGMASCHPGGNGEGGIYRPGAASCEDGAIVPAGMKLCKKGPNGSGGTYNPSALHCDGGQVY
jgi:hypothetical protein